MDTSKSLCKKGETYRKQKRYRQAIDVLREAIKIDNTSDIAPYMLGEVYFELSSQDDNKKMRYLELAKKNLLRAQRINNRRIEIELTLLRVLAGLGDTKELINSYKRAKEIDPKHRELRKRSRKIEKLIVKQDASLKNYQGVSKDVLDLNSDETE